MPVPKRKRSRARRDSRFANKSIKVKALATCKNCNQPHMPHTVCKSCGHYKGIKVLTTKNDRTSKRLEIRQAEKSARSSSGQESAE